MGKIKYDSPEEIWQDLKDCRRCSYDECLRHCGTMDECFQMAIQALCEEVSKLRKELKKLKDNG